MKRSNPFSFISNAGRKRPRTDAGQSFENQLCTVASLPQHTPVLLAEPQYEHVQPAVAIMRLRLAKNDERSSLLSWRVAERIAPQNNDAGHGVNIIAHNAAVDLQWQWSDSQDVRQRNLSNKSNPDETYWSEMIMLFTSVLSILIGYYISF